MRAQAWSEGAVAPPLEPLVLLRRRDAVREGQARRLATLRPMSASVNVWMSSNGPPLMARARHRVAQGVGQSGHAQLLWCSLARLAAVCMGRGGTRSQQI